MTLAEQNLMAAIARSLRTIALEKINTPNMSAALRDDWKTNYAMLDTALRPFAPMPTR